MAEPNRLERYHALRNANLDMAFATVFGALVAGSFLQEFIRQLTSDDRIRAWLSALPAILGILMIPGSVLGERQRNYKSFVAIGGLLWRLFWIPVVFLPLLPPSWPRLEILFACIVLQAVSIFTINATYNQWLSQLVPESHRGWYFSRRFALGIVVGAVVGFPTSLFADVMRESGMTNVGLSIIFAVGVVCGLISYMFYLRMPSTERTSVASGTMVESLRSLGAPFSHRPFRRLFVFLVVFTVAQVIGGPFFFYYGREVLELRLIDLTIIGSFMAAASLASAPMWGFLSDKYGNKPVLFVSGALLALGPLAWTITSPGAHVWNYTVLIVGHIAAGLAWTGVQSGQFSFTLAVAKPEHRAQAIGLTQALGAVVGGLAPMASGVWLEFSKGIFDEPTGYTILFGVNSLLRVVSVLFLFGIVDPTSHSIRTFIKQVASVRPTGVLAMKKLSQSAEASERQLAIQRIGEAGMMLAESELVKLLKDPSPRVRREAAVALATVGGKEAASALIDLVESHPYLVEEEMVDALGASGDPTAVEALIKLLENPSSALRRASARALGKLGDERALESLIGAADHPGDAELRRASIQALRTIGNPRCEEVLVKRLEDPYPSVRIAAAEAIAELDLRGGAPVLRKLLQNELDDSAAEFAYALGRVGNDEDAALILQAANQMTSVTARRRCLLGAAYRFGVEAEFYRLILQDSMGLDKELVQIARGGDSDFTTALTKFHQGQEAEAIRVLAERVNSPELCALAKAAPQDGFLLAAVLWHATRS